MQKQLYIYIDIIFTIYIYSVASFTLKGFWQGHFLGNLKIC